MPSKTVVKIFLLLNQFINGFLVFFSSIQIILIVADPGDRYLFIFVGAWLALLFTSIASAKFYYRPLMFSAAILATLVFIAFTIITVLFWDGQNKENDDDDDHEKRALLSSYSLQYLHNTILTISTIGYAALASSSFILWSISAKSPKHLACCEPPANSDDPIVVSASSFQRSKMPLTSLIASVRFMRGISILNLLISPLYPAGKSLLDNYYSLFLESKPPVISDFIQYISVGTAMLATIWAIVMLIVSFEFHLHRRLKAAILVHCFVTFVICLAHTIFWASLETLAISPWGIISAIHLFLLTIWMMPAAAVIYNDVTRILPPNTPSCWPECGTKAIVEETSSTTMVPMPPIPVEHVIVETHQTANVAS